MKNEFDWHIQINKMQNLNDMIGKQLECVDAERLAHTRQKKIRSKKRKDTFVAAKRRHNLCASRGVGGKHTEEGFMKKGYTHGSFHENPYSHYAKHGLKNKAPAKNYSISTYRRECAVENKMMEYMSDEPFEKLETYEKGDIILPSEKSAWFEDEELGAIKSIEYLPVNQEALKEGRTKQAKNTNVSI